MTLWQQPAQLLPVRVRPIGGETVVSYVFRLAAANALKRPTTLLRALGEPINGTPFASMIHNRDLTLNAPALARLETFTGLPADQLRKALPSLSNPRADPLPQTDPTIRVFRSAAIRDHCHPCIARIPGRPQVRVHDRDAPSICRRHRRWIETTSYHPDQIDLSENIEIITAHRRLGRLRSTVGDHAWVRQQLRHASWIALDWHLARALFQPQLLHLQKPAHARGQTRSHPAPIPNRNHTPGHARNRHARRDPLRSRMETPCRHGRRRPPRGPVLSPRRPTPRTTRAIRRPAVLLHLDRTTQELGHRASQPIPNIPREALETSPHPPPLRPLLQQRHPPDNPPLQVRNDANDNTTPNWRAPDQPTSTSPEQTRTDIRDGNRWLESMARLGTGRTGCLPVASRGNHWCPVTVDRPFCQ
ncbi:hypothetical protein GFS60_06434 (plasmid) [Rhodococcus sp. WAY2]|nr:hypothetical protein GFS60_06434 [Rhodococcus sp. WAY2]